MKGFKQFSENSEGKKLIICDVQPAYAKSIYFMKEFAQFVNQYQDILVLFNGPDLGLEGKAEIARWYMQYGITKQKLFSMKWHQKGYGFFRDHMDACWERESIIRIIRYMLRHRINDIRDLTRQAIKTIGVPDLTFRKLEQHHLAIPDLRGILPKWDGADICGGGFNECLDEVMILSEAMRLKLRIVPGFTY
jgi:hypothetical protein